MIRTKTNEKIREYVNYKFKANTALHRLLTDEQHTAIAIIATMRHELHSTYCEYFNTEVENKEREEKSKNFFERLMPIMLRAAGLPEMKLSVDILHRTIKCDDIASRNAIEKLNGEIENYLSAIDNAYGTDYCPTGIRRQKKQEELQTA